MRHYFIPIPVSWALDPELVGLVGESLWCARYVGRKTWKVLVFVPGKSSFFAFRVSLMDSHKV